MAKSLRILVVEDSSEKYSRVNQLLSDRLPGIYCQFSWAKNYNQAFKELNDSLFDLVILDLRIPLSNGTVSAENSRALIELMNAGDILPVLHVIGLTEYRDAAREEKKYFEENMLTLELFSWTSSTWADRLAAKIRYIVKSKAAVLNYSINNFESDLLIMIARYENEYKPILKRIKWQAPPVSRSSYFPAHHYASGRLIIDAGRSLRTTCLCIGEMGSTAAAALTSQAITIFRPQLVTMLGMCCGFKSPKSASPALLGDILFARATASWEEGKYLELQGGDLRFFQNRAVVRTVDNDLTPILISCVEAAKDELRPLSVNYINSNYVKAIKRECGDDMRAVPDYKVGMIVSGSSVIADTAKTDEIISRLPNALGLDMEIFGIFTAAQTAVGKKPSVFAVKGVADFGTGAKHKRTQAMASVLAFYGLIGILRKLESGGYFIYE